MSKPVLDSGWPVSNGVTNSTVNGFSVSTPTTKGTSRLIVVTVTLRNNVYINSQPTVSGLGLSWTKVVSNEDGADTCDFWAAWAGAKLSAGTISISYDVGGSPSTGIATCYAYTGTADGSKGVANCIGDTTITGDGSGAGSTLRVSLTGCKNTSEALFNLINESQPPNSLTMNSISTADTHVDDTTLGLGLYQGHDNTTITSTTTLGASTTAWYWLASAVEILGWTRPLHRVVEGPIRPHVEQRNRRPMSDQFRSPWVPLTSLTPLPQQELQGLRFRPWSPLDGAGITTYYPPPPVAPTWSGAILPEVFLRPIWSPERSAVAVPQGFFSAGPPLEVGWPVFASMSGASVSSLSVSTPPTSGLDRLIYVTVAWYSGSTAPGPITVSGLGLPWVKICGADAGPPFVQQEGAEVWAAWAHTALDAGVVTASFTNVSPTYAVVTAYARMNTAGLGNPTAAFGATATKMDETGAASSRTVTLTGTTIGSAAVVVLVDGSASPYGPADNTSFDSFNTALVTMGSGSLVGNSGGGAIPIGMSGTGAYYTIAAAEILPATAASMLAWGFLGPEAARLIWNPPRGLTAQPAMYLPVVIPSLGLVLTPEGFPSIWIPNRSSIMSPTLAVAAVVVVPKSPVPPLLPENFLRPVWNPNRSQHFESDKVTYVTPYGILSGPPSPRVNERFTVTLQVGNPRSRPVYVLGVEPWIEGRGPFTIGAVSPQGAPVVPNRLDANLSAGLIPVRTGESQAFTFECVAFMPGAYHLQATIDLDDGTFFEALEAVITVLPLA